jgi:arylsulfatase A-like enzyme
MSLHPSRCNGYVIAQHNKAARHFGMPRTLLAALLLLVALAAPVPAFAAEKPNLLVIITDDQRADGTLDVMPATRRKIGGQGITFDDAYATTPKCCPSRASFFTGLYAHNHGVISNGEADKLDHTTTVQRLVRNKGYRTAIFGKFLNAWPVEVNPPFFDDWAISNGNYNKSYWNIGGQPRTKRSYSVDFVAKKAARFIRDADREDDDQPWLEWVTPYAPHLPSTPPDRYRNALLPAFPVTPAMQETDLSDKPDFLTRAYDHDNFLATMRDDGRRSLMAVDDLVRRLMDQLKKHGEVDNTLVVFASDNGFMLGEHGGVVAKDLPYPASTRIPLMLRWPGHARKGRTSDKLVANLDVAATLLKAAGVRRRTDGRSLLDPGRRDALLVESRGSYNEDRAPLLPGFRSVRTPDYRYTEYYRHNTFDLVFREYYDLTVDPWELENRADDLPPEQVAALSQQLQDYGTCRRAECP